MANKMLKTILLNVEKGNVEELEVENELHAFYKTMNVDMIEFTYRKIGKKVFTIMCDEEGLLKGNPIPSAINERGQVQIVGNLLFFNDSDDGDLKSLSEKDIKEIKENLIMYGGTQPLVILGE